MKNKIYKITGDYAFEAKSVDEKSLKEARQKALGLMKATQGEAIALRSCWNCNSAHSHFLKGDWGDWVLNCFDCGKFYYNKIDITDYE